MALGVFVPSYQNNRQAELGTANLPFKCFNMEKDAMATQRQMFAFVFQNAATCTCQMRNIHPTSHTCYWAGGAQGCAWVPRLQRGLVFRSSSMGSRMMCLFCC